MMNESVKKSLEKSKNVLEEKRKIVKQKICIKKTHVYNNCYELRSRAINKDSRYFYNPLLAASGNGTTEDHSLAYIRP